MKLTFLIFIIIPFIAFTQKGKDGIKIINTTTIVNEFAVLVNDASINDTQLTISQTSLNDNNRFENNLQPGDLVLIHQAQGASVDANAEPFTGNGIYGLPYSSDWGAITNYNNCGNYEYAEVATVNSSTQISLRCGLTKNYTASGKVQIVRIPRFETLTINDSLTTQQWDGNKGGILAIEVNGDIIINQNGVINASELGFRGGLASLKNNIFGAGEFASINPNHGGMKGEGIAGFQNDYTPMGGQFGKGACANAGGGSTSHNAGGGGGGNAGDINNWNNGVGNPNPLYNNAWALESPSIANINSSGGGRGGYTFSDDNQNANSVPPGDNNWGGDNRQNDGGLGGRPLDYSLGKLFFGGGGGAGELNDSENEGASGGNAGGIILIKTFGNITGNGKIEANGENGENVFSDNPPAFNYAGNDSAGGGGAGGTIKVDNTATNSIGTITFNTNGGNGGNQDLERGALFIQAMNEAEGPGGGGSGGYISIPANSATSNNNGGINGTTDSNALTEFPSNGATSGGNGITANNVNNLNNIFAENDTVCYNEIATLTASTTNSLGANETLIWYDNDYNIVGNGITFTTGNITSDTSFIVGICPGNTSIEVNVIINSSFTIDTSNLQLLNEHCNQSDGSITGINTIGGVQSLSYEWNGISSPTLDLNNLESGSYELIITDGNGCGLNAGVFSILNELGPTIDSSSIILNNENCNQQNGAITGIEIQNGSAPFTYNWNGNSSTIDIQNLTSGNYNLIVIDNFGCTDTSFIYEINNESGPSIDTTSIFITPETCGQINGAIANIIISDGSSPYSYNWNNNSTELDLANLNGGNYTLTVTDANNCINTMNIVVPSFGFPTPGFNTDTNTYFTDQSFLITNTASNNATEWTYDLGNGVTSNSKSPIISYSNSGHYEICQTVSTNYNCTAEFCDSIFIVEENLPLITPNVFTPNNDGENELFIIKNIVEKTTLSIFDRWGNKVFEEENYQNDWDGTTNSGNKLSEGTYYYIISSKENYSGFFNLMR